MADKQTTTTYDPSSTYNAARNAAQSKVNNQSDLSRYGIDYSQAQQDAIANIFKNSANAAYNTAQNQYSQDIANQQATLSDTIRRSQAEAVATGASRGMQAANELSSMLGLQQAAAQGATQLQGDYASALAQAQQQAADLQTQRAQIGAELFNADRAAEAQEYTANMEFAANDFNRILSEAANLRAQGYGAQADMLLKSYMAANGMTSEDINSAMADAGAAGMQQTEWTAGKDGVISNARIQTNEGNYTDLKYEDLEKGKNESGRIQIDGHKYYVEFSGAAVDGNTAAKLSALAGNAATGSVVYYNGAVYLYSGTGWHKATGTGRGANDRKNYDQLLDKLKNG